MKTEQMFSLRVVTGIQGRTVDYLRDPGLGREGGAYIRVLPRPSSGSVVLMTVPIPPGVTTEAVAATLRDELEALVRLVERL